MTTVQTLPFPLVRALVETYYDFQSQRIMTNSRIQNNIERNQIPSGILEQFGLNDLFKKAESFESDIKKLLDKERRHWPISAWLEQLYGFGPVISTALVAYLESPKKFDNISKLWQYSGFGMNTYCPKCEKPTSVEVEFEDKTGKKKKAKRLNATAKCPDCNSDTVKIIQRRHAGYLSNWNDKMKVLGWKIGQSIEKQGTKSAYYVFYKQVKDEERQRNPTKFKDQNGKTKFNDGHIRNRALRKTVKLFLAHLWIQWRLIEGLPISQPYVGKILNHDVIQPFTDNKKTKTDFEDNNDDIIFTTEDMENIDDNL